MCGQIGPDVTVQPILSSPGPLKLTVGNWSLISQKEGEVSIHNADGTKVSDAQCNRLALGGLGLDQLEGVDFSIYYTL